MKYKIVVCGGTFDHLHEGHKAFLRFGLLHGKMLVVGLTSDTFAKKQKEGIEPFPVRKKALETFFAGENSKHRVTIIEIDNEFGPTLDQKFHADALLVSDETKKDGMLINTRRKEKGLPELPLLIFPLQKTTSGRIASTNIRKGISDRKGKKWIDPLWLKKTLILPEELRESLKTPLGRFVNEEELLTKFSLSLRERARVRVNPFLVTVGDEVTKTANKLKLFQHISIIDFTVQRKKIYTKIEEVGFAKTRLVQEIRNKPGTINGEVFAVLENCFATDQQSIILVDGEEDLLVLPVILTVPLGTSILYGQPHEGMVLLTVSENLKVQAQEIVSKFRTTGH